MSKKAIRWFTREKNYKNGYILENYEYFSEDLQNNSVSGIINYLTGSSRQVG